MMGPGTQHSRVRRREQPAKSDADLEDRCLRLFDALRDLYELLEEFAPSWYNEQHHEKAAAALEMKGRSRRK